MKQRFNSIESVLADLRKGRMVIVVDDADRENEGDLIMRRSMPRGGDQFHGAVWTRIDLLPTTSGRLEQLGIDAWCGKIAKVSGQISR